MRLIFLAVMTWSYLVWTITPPVHYGHNGRPTVVQDPIQFGTQKVWTVDQQIELLRYYLRQKGLEHVTNQSQGLSSSVEEPIR